MRGSIADENYDKRENKEKRFFRHVTSVGQRKNSESPRGIEPQTFGFRSPMLYCITRNVRL